MTHHSDTQILTVERMQAAEQALIDGGETVGTLMETAGGGAAHYVWRMAAGRSVTVLCGPGNNGGDGYVIARRLSEAGLPVSVVAPIEPKTDAAIAAREAWGGTPVESASGTVFVDCLFGSGLARPLDDNLAGLLRDLASSHERSIAIDLPSGVASDTGEMLNEGLPDYHLTISLGAWKFAHWLMPAMTRMGERRLVDIGVSQDPQAARVVSKPRLSPPAPDAHKYSRGLLAVVGGPMPGAGAMAARAAMHAGAGYVKLFAEHKSPATPDELVVDDSPLDDALADDRIGTLLIGPGLGRDDAACERLAKVMARDLPTVCDADALVLLEPEMLSNRSAPLIVTPHAGELSALESSFDTGGDAKPERAARLAEATGAVVVAKGPDTLIAGPGAPLRLAATSTSWLSTAGTGDVLAGMVASRLATGQEPVEAAAQAVWLHSEAARQAGPAFTAGDLIRAVPAAFAPCL